MICAFGVEVDQAVLINIEIIVNTSPEQPRNMTLESFTVHQCTSIVPTHV